MKCPPMRFWIAVMIFMTTFTNYMLRINISVGVVSMVDREYQNYTSPCQAGDKSKIDFDYETYDVNEEENRVEYDDDGEIFQDVNRYDWDENQVGFIISAYFYGYIATAIPGGILTDILGPFHVILWSTLASSAVTASTPFCADISANLVIVNRFVIGLLGGVIYPAVNVLIANWAPPDEKGKFLVMMLGNSVGVIVSFNLVAWLTKLWEWRWGFYVVALMVGVFYCIPFGIVVRDAPRDHPWISEKERNYIEESLKDQILDETTVPPYRKILRSLPFWMIAIAQFGNLWFINLILTYTPKYFVEALNYDLQVASGLTGLLCLVRLVASYSFGNLGDYMKMVEITKVTKLRKFFMVFSHFIPAICLFFIPTVGCEDSSVSVFLLLVGQALNGAAVVGHLINPHDLTPNFSGTIYGMINFIGAFTGMFVPSVTGAVNIAYNMRLEAPNVIFTIAGIVLVITGFLYHVFGTAEEQPWNYIGGSKEPPPEDKATKRGKEEANEEYDEDEEHDIEKEAVYAISKL